MLGLQACQMSFIMSSLLCCLVGLSCSMIAEHVLPHILMTNQFIGTGYMLSFLVKLNKKKSFTSLYCTDHLDS